MRRGLWLSALLWALLTFPVSADPIRIIGGSLVIDQPSPPLGVLNIEGFDDFRLSAITEAVDLGHQCSPCAPGDSLNLSGFARAGHYVTLQGGPVPSNPPWRPRSLFAYRFEAENVIVPPLGTSGILTSPFVFTGPLIFDNIDQAARPTMSFELFGRGTATVELRPNPFGTPVWEFARARYEFAPVPEPTTLLLVSSGLAAVAWRRGRRRRPE